MCCFEWQSNVCQVNLTCGHLIQQWMSHYRAGPRSSLKSPGGMHWRCQCLQSSLIPRLTPYLNPEISDEVWEYRGGTFPTTEKSGQNLITLIFTL